MWEEIFELAASKWGLMGLGTLVVLAGPGRKVIRGAAKELVKAGLGVSDAAREFVAEVKEQGGDLMAEVRAERKEEQKMKSSGSGEAAQEKKAKKAAE